MAFTLGLKGMRELFPRIYLDMLYEIYTPKEVDSILKSYLTGRRTTFRLNRLKENSEATLEELRKKNIKLDKCNYCNDVYMLRDGSERIIQQTESYKKGYVYMQNLSSIIPAVVLGTCEYDKVLVFEEFLKGGDHDRWLYTAATRAKEKLVIVRNFR